MEEKTLNITIKLPAHEVPAFESWLRYHVDVKDFKILHDTEHLQNDPTFLALLKQKYEAQRRIDNYINDHYYV